MSTKADNRITVRSVLLGVFISALFAFLTVYFANRKNLYITATQIPVLPYALLLLTVLAINPLCRLVRVIRRFTQTEILIVFLMGLVSSGLSTFGMTAQLVPMVGNLFNSSWNNQQSEWSRHIVPFLNENYFLSVPGIQKAAMEYRTTVVEHQHIEGIYGAADRLQVMADRVSEVKRALADARAPGGAAGDRALRVSRLEQSLATAEETLATAQSEWDAIRDKHGLGEPAAVREEYGAKLEASHADVERIRASLGALEEEAFARVELFRRGLPTGMSAYPGAIPMVEDNAESYFGRLRRLVKGRAAQKPLKALYDRLDDDPSSSAEASAVIERAIDALAPISDDTHFREEAALAETQYNSILASIQDHSTELRDLSAQRRNASRDEFSELDARIEDLRDRVESLSEEKDELRTAQERLGRELQSCVAVQGVLADLEALRSRIDGGETLPADEIRARLKGILGQFPSFDASLRRYFLGDVPWSHWIGPLLRWSALIGLTYVVLMTFNVLIFRQWAYHEKLIYPLAELPQSLAGCGDEEGNMWWPSVFRDGLFWAGALISGGVLGWNLLCSVELIPGFTALNLSNSWSAAIANTAFEGLRPGARSTVFFTMIGLAFLIPKKVSFSLWFFHIIYMVQLLILVWSGQGENENSFPMEWYYTFNFRTAEGAGALLVFSSAVMWKCKRYIFCAFFPRSVSELERDERVELRISSFLFLAASLGVILILWRGMGANLYYTVFAYFIIMVTTIGLIRAVTEGGLLGFQAWVGPFHYVKSFLGMNKAWSAPAMFVPPLMVYYFVLFADIKTFIAPAMANSLKIRSDLKMRRLTFHAAIFFAILLAGVVSVAASVMMSYSEGADLMNRWFHTGFPKGVYARMTAMLKTAEDMEFVLGDCLWAGMGAVAMGALLYFRQFLFWLPHPIGMIMLVNPIMKSYWFSFLLGWLAKSLVTKYGNNETYARTRLFFIGLIAGELILVTVTMCVSYALDKPIDIDLNRN